MTSNSSAPLHSSTALLIANPVAGHYSPRRLAKFVRQLEQTGLTVQVILTTHQNHGAEIVQNLPGRRGTNQQQATGPQDGLPQEGPAIIIAGGGDGTIAGIAGAMLDHPAPPLLALWPVGSANVLAREIGVPFDDARNAALIASGQHRPFWPGLLHVAGQDRPVPFLQMAGIGLDGWIVQHLSLRLKKRIGRLAYLLAALRLPLARSCPSFTITVEGKARQGRLAIISKGRLYGGPYALFPRSCHHEPGFSVLILHSLNPLALCRQWLERCLKRESRHRAVSLTHGQAVSCTATRPVPAQSDGDFRGTTPLHVMASKLPVNIICF